MKPSRYIPGVWKGEPDGMLPLTEADWVDLMRKNRTELEREATITRTNPPIPPFDTDAA